MSEPSQAEQVVGGLVGGAVNLPLGSLVYTVRHLPVDIILMHASMGGGYWAPPMMLMAGLTTLAVSPIMGVVEGAQQGSKGLPLAFRSPWDLLLKKDVENQYLEQVGMRLETIEEHHENAVTPTVTIEEPVKESQQADTSSSLVLNEPKKGMLFSQKGGEAEKVEPSEDPNKSGSSFKP